MGRSFKAWLLRQRTVTRLAFLLQIGCRVLTALLNLIWTPLLLSSMGRGLNGLFLSFQAVAYLGGLGDFGMGGVVNIRTSRLLGQQDETGLQKFLASARSFFLLMAAVTTGGLLLLAPVLPGWLRFDSLPGAGSLPMMFAAGAIGAGFLILSSYTTNLNYGCGNITWAVVPMFLLQQFCLLGHWVLARSHAPLWLQHIAYVLATLGTVGMTWALVRLSHPALARWRPLAWERHQFMNLAKQSFWVYLYCLGSGVYLATARLVINARFGAEVIPTYQYNSKLCDLALFIIGSATLVSMPKVTQWLHSPEEALRQSGRRESRRLNQFQTFLGCAAALAYLAANDVFMRFWLGPGFEAPPLWEAAFAANMAVTAAGLVGYELCARLSDQSLRFGGITVGVTALINLGLSLLGAQVGSIFLIAMAGAVSNTVLVLATGWKTCRCLEISWWQLVLKPWLLATGVVTLGTVVRFVLPLEAPWRLAGMGLFALAVLGGVAAALGIRLADLKNEARILRGLFTGGSPPDKTST
jgi:hypothetical protein